MEDYFAPEHLIGHIKGMLDTKDNGHLFFSIISFDEKIGYKKKLFGKTEKTFLTINVIVYGLETNTIDKGVQKSLFRHFGDILRIEQDGFDFRY